MALQTKPVFAIWLTGLPASGKSTVAAALKKLLNERGVDVAVLESDVLRKVLSDRPGYSEADRDAFYKRIVWIGSLLTHHGVPVIFDATANRRRYRLEARVAFANFLEVFVDTPLEVCIERDPKGIYHAGAEGLSGNVPGTQVPYERPEYPDMTIDGMQETPAGAAARILAALLDREYIPLSGKTGQR